MMVTLGANDQQFLEARTVCPTPGLLVLFPSWLSHSVDRLDEGALDEGPRPFWSSRRPLQRRLWSSRSQANESLNRG